MPDNVTELRRTGPFFICSIVKTRREDRYITFWRPDDAGYAWPLSWAGEYSLERVNGNMAYYHNGERSVAVDRAAVEALAVDPAPGDVDGNAGPVVLNTPENWAKIMLAVHSIPPSFPKPAILQRTKK